MPREPPTVRVYTVCDESKHLIVRNVPSLGCGDELANLFATYGPVDECTPMDAEDCEPYTDVFFVKFSQVSNARCTPMDAEDCEPYTDVFFIKFSQVSNAREYTKTLHASQIEDPRFIHVSSNKDCFPSKSMNATVNLLREKLDTIQQRQFQCCSCIQEIKDL